ncbi:hypothetical protein Tco_1493513 [Tanacetum coccineum]
MESNDGAIPCESNLFQDVNFLSLIGKIVTNRFTLIVLSALRRSDTENRQEILLKMNLPDHRIKLWWKWRYLVPVESIHSPMLTLNVFNQRHHDNQKTYNTASATLISNVMIKKSVSMPVRKSQRHMKEETGQDCNFTRRGSKTAYSAWRRRRDSLRRRQDVQAIASEETCDGIWTNRLKEALVDSAGRRRRNFQATPRKKKKSLDCNNLFLGKYEYSSLALDREERRDEKKQIGSLETRSNNVVIKRFSVRKKFFKERKKSEKIRAKRAPRDRSYEIIATKQGEGDDKEFMVMGEVGGVLLGGGDGGEEGRL